MLVLKPNEHIKLLSNLITEGNLIKGAVTLLINGCFTTYLVSIEKNNLGLTDNTLTIKSITIELVKPNE